MSSEEQLTISKVIQFPKNKEMESRKKQEKLEFVEIVVEYLINNDLPFSLILDKNTTLELFEVDFTKLKEYQIITNDREFSRKLKIDKNASISTIGDNATV